MQHSNTNLNAQSTTPLTWIHLLKIEIMRVPP